MTPPTHATASQWSFNSCGWHTGSCYNNTNPNALDWGYYNGWVYDYNVRFRGWLYRNNTPSSNGYLILLVYKVGPGGSQFCDETAADVVEIQPWVTRFGMHYLHTTALSVSGNLYVSGTGIGDFNSPTVAYMINDGGCPWNGYHAHTWLAQNLLTHYEENRAVYPCCNYGGKLVTNNYEPNFTHKVRWWQGHFP